MIWRRLRTKIDNKYKKQEDADKGEVANSYQAKAQLLMGRYQDEYKREEKGTALKLLDKVLYSDPAIVQTKLGPRWSIEAVIIEVLYDAYKIQNADGKIFTTNKKYVQPFRAAV
ncbi:hypothetical protein PAEPH01_2109 [Pancytospora epiphaga]|nr:hypothetical protein PAEPH01_2109 [Pancytospora epiphaga]